MGNISNNNIGRSIIGVDNTNVSGVINTNNDVLYPGQSIIGFNLPTISPTQSGWVMVTDGTTTLGWTNSISGYGGATGPAGATGATGPAGATGATGPDGSTASMSLSNTLLVGSTASTSIDMNGNDITEINQVGYTDGTTIKMINIINMSLLTLMYNT